MIIPYDVFCILYNTHEGLSWTSITPAVLKEGLLQSKFCFIFCPMRIKHVSSFHNPVAPETEQSSYERSCTSPLLKVMIRGIKIHHWCFYLLYVYNKVKMIFPSATSLPRNHSSDKSLKRAPDELLCNISI